MRDGFFFYEIILRKSPVEAPDMPLGEALTMVERLVDRGEAVWIYNNGLRAFRVRKLEIDRSRQVAAILVNYADVDDLPPLTGPI